MRIILFFLFVLSISIYAQEPMNVIRDVHGDIVYVYCKSDSLLQKKAFYYKKDVRYFVTNRVHYKSGREALLQYLERAYYSSSEYDYQEYNTFLVYIMLFDAEMKIKDVRIIYRPSNIDDRFDDFLKSALYKTKNKWKPQYKSRNDGYMIYMDYFHIW